MCAYGRELIHQHQDLHIGQTPAAADCPDGFVMPVMDGARATQLITQDFPHIKVIGFSSIAAGEEVMMSSGAFLILKKGLSR